MVDKSSQEKMKIVFVYPYIMPYRIQFFKQIARLYDIKFIFTRAEKSKLLEKLKGQDYEILHTFLKIPWGLPFRLLKSDYEILVDSNWDSLPNLFTALICFTIAKLKGKKFVMYRGEWDWGRKSFQRKIMSPAISVLVRYSDAAFTYGIKSKEHLVNLGMESNRIFIASNSSLITEPVYEEDIQELKIQLRLENKKVILYVGRLIKLKGLQYLIPAFAKLREEREDVALLLIGEGKSKRELEKLCRKYNVERDVKFIAPIHWEKLGIYYSLANIFVIPSIWLGYADAFPMALNEAMSFGKPVIATDMVGSSYELIKDGINGYVVPQKQIMPLYLAMKKITNNPEIEESMGRNSKKIIENGYTYTHMAAGFQQAIEYARKRYSKV